MVIGIFTDTFYPEINGVATSVILLKKELEKLGNSVYVFTSNNPALKECGDIDNTFRLPSAPFLFLPSRRVAVVYKRSIAHKIRSLNLDIVHTNTEFSLGMFGKLIAAALNIPVIHTYHTLYEDYVHYISKGRLVAFTTEMAKLFSRFYCNNSHAIIVPTEKTRDLLLSYNVYKHIDVIPTGIDIEPFRYKSTDEQKIKSLKAYYGISEKDRVILYVGRLAWEKNIHVIVKQLPKYIKNYAPNTKLLLVGDGPLKKELMRIAEANGILDNIIFTGEQPWREINNYYKMGDAFISASLSETQGLTFIEAMAAGLPVIAKKDRSVEKLIIDGHSGCLFESDDEIPAVLSKVFDDESLRRKISANAVRIAEDNSAERFARSVLDSYNNTLISWESRGDRTVIGKKILNKLIL